MSFAKLHCQYSYEACLCCKSKPLLLRASSANEMSLPIPLADASYVAEIRGQCDKLQPKEKLALVEKEIRVACDNLEHHYLRLDALIDMVTSNKLYIVQHLSHRAWLKSLGPDTTAAVDQSRAHKGKCMDLSSKIHQAWGVWPWQLVEDQHQPHCWSKGILDGILRLAKTGCEQTKATDLLAQARIDRACRDYSDRRLGTTREDVLTKSDVTNALEKYTESSAECEFSTCNSSCARLLSSALTLY